MIDMETIRETASSLTQWAINLFSQNTWTVCDNSMVKRYMIPMYGFPISGEVGHYDWVISAVLFLLINALKVGYFHNSMSREQRETTMSIMGLIGLVTIPGSVNLPAPHVIFILLGCVILPMYSLPNLANVFLFWLLAFSLVAHYVLDVYFLDCILHNAYIRSGWHHSTILGVILFFSIVNMFMNTGLMVEESLILNFSFFLFWVCLGFFVTNGIGDLMDVKLPLWFMAYFPIVRKFIMYAYHYKTISYALNMEDILNLFKLYVL